MKYTIYDDPQLPAFVNISRFQGLDGVDEYHLVVRPTEYGRFPAQLDTVLRAYQSALDSLGLNSRTAVLRRFICSDLPNQASVLESHPLSNPRGMNEPCAVSWIGQAPEPPAKVTLWAYHLNDPKREPDTRLEGSTLTLRRGELSHHWTVGIANRAGATAYDQTRGLLGKYGDNLKARGLTLADHLIRTWLFVQNVDANYEGLVVARREFFAEHGLTPDTHYVASTGIEGSGTDVDAKVTMDAYAISGLRPGQVEFLSAPEHLCPTHFYRVTFERGVSVAYRDRKHVIISGTASIDHQGNIMYPGDVSRQLGRAIENVEALLGQAGATLGDMNVLIVYVRDPSDLAVARQQVLERFGAIPMEVVIAPVCRPGWLIEIEGMAIIPASNATLPDF